MNDTNYDLLFNQVKNHSEFSSWQQQSQTELRDKENKLSLTKYGIKDWRSNEITESLVQIAKRLGIINDSNNTNVDNNSSPSTNKNVEILSSTEFDKMQYEFDAEQQKERAKVNDYFNNNINDESGEYILEKYLRSRNLNAGMLSTVLNSVDIKVKKTKVAGASATYEILIPIQNAKGEQVKLSRIIVDENGNKIQKKQLGKYSDCAVTKFGSSNCNEIFIVEGFEDALTLYQYLNTKKYQVAFIVTHGASTLSKCAALVEDLRRKLIAKGNKNVLFTALLDNDSSHASLLASESLPAFITRKIPSQKYQGVDANKSLVVGGLGDADSAGGLDDVDSKKKNFQRWYNALEVVSNKDINKIKIIKEQIASPIYQLHKEVIESCFHEIKLDIVSNEALCKVTPKANWSHIEDAKQKNIIKGACRVRNSAIEKINKTLPQGAAKEALYQPAQIDEFLALYINNELRPQLLIDVPEWDGRDRLREISDRVMSAEYSNDDIFQILREWCAKSWLRIFDPTIEQHFLIFTGAQRCGKSWLCQALGAGYGLNYDEIVLDYNRTVVQRSLSDLIVAYIDEFDQYSKASVAMLKDLISKATSKFDQKYVKGDVRHTPKYSFIGTANTNDLLRDHTGNRRYRIIPIDYIEARRKLNGLIDEDYNNYPGDNNDPEKEQNRLQLIAQYKFMAESGNYKVDDGLFDRIYAKNAEMTPEDPDIETCLLWCETVSGFAKRRFGGVGITGGADSQTVFDKYSNLNMSADEEKWKWIYDNGIISLSDCTEPFEQVRRARGWKPVGVNRALANYGLKDRKHVARTYLGAQMSRFIVFDINKAFEKGWVEMLPKMKELLQKLGEEKETFDDVL